MPSLWRRSLTADDAAPGLIARRKNISAFDHENHGALSRACSMAHTFRHNEALPWCKFDYAIFEIDHEPPIEHEKELINICMFVPVIFALNDRHPHD